jgi:hypothetical protein
MKGMGLIFVLAGSLSVAASAKSAPTTAPAPTTVPAHAPTTADVHAQAPKVSHPQTPTPPSTSKTDEWPAAQAFFEAHSPRRWRALESLRPESNARLKIQNYITNRYRSLKEQEKKDPEMYKLQVKELELEDQIFGQASRRHHQDNPEFQEQLKKEAAELVDTRLGIRQLRITRLEKAVDQAKSRLEKDKQQRDQLIEREIRQATHQPFSRHRREDRLHPRPTTRHASTQPATQPAR